MSQELLEQYLAERDEPCPACGYNLRNLRGGHCPECGDGLRLHVGLAEPKRAAFLTGLIGLSAGGGFSGLVLMYALGVILFQTRAGPTPFDVLLLLGQTLFAAALMAVWIRGARRVRRFSSAIQWSLAAACCLLAPVNLFVFAMLVR